jgi:hypothetical protein
MLPVTTVLIDIPAGGLDVGIVSGGGGFGTGSGFKAQPASASVAINEIRAVHVLISIPHDVDTRL